MRYSHFLSPFCFSHTTVQHFSRRLFKQDLSCSALWNSGSSFWSSCNTSTPLKCSPFKFFSISLFSVLYSFNMIIECLSLFSTFYMSRCILWTFSLDTLNLSSCYCMSMHLPFLVSSLKHSCHFFSWDRNFSWPILSITSSIVRTSFRRLHDSYLYVSDMVLSSFQTACSLPELRSTDNMRLMPTKLSHSFMLFCQYNFSPILNIATKIDAQLQFLLYLHRRKIPSVIVSYLPSFLIFSLFQVWMRQNCDACITGTHSAFIHLHVLNHGIESSMDIYNINNATILYMWKHPR